MVSDGSVDITLEAIGSATVVVGTGVAWGDLDDLGIVCDGVVMFALVLVQSGTIDCDLIGRSGEIYSRPLAPGAETGETQRGRLSVQRELPHQTSSGQIFIPSDIEHSAWVFSGRVQGFLPITQGDPGGNNTSNAR